ncbi:sulfate ABC transporter substrate-binding protein [Actinomadura darangshiensis]|uniref:Sulfate ABC transporter substrate-binding protein n=1 Tax=Actinomadura darangshiensis TaxID=705336 RepID=A0A4R5BHY1_9ACTN|nr:sulfate ABC transporter substrate-binding protein [Actinomadura darangshiensis]TDD85109.1 sulfate ABC transporter substrate-binding protein [Actinomadura darangshiensis]
MRARRTGVVLGLAAVTLGAAACGSGGSGGKVRLSLVAYSTPQAAYEAIIKEYQKTSEGKKVVFSKSFGASGEQSRAVASGKKADIVGFSLESDMTRLVDKGLVDAKWNSGPQKGMVTDSVVVLATRKGNPKNIKTWDDLTKPGVQVITPNPFTSGGAQWNILAGYGAKANKGTDKAAGTAYLHALFKNVPVQDSSARKSLQTFAGGKGDVMLSYENEAIFAKQNNQPLDYTVPDSTILIENPVAVTKKSEHPAEAEAFLKFLHGKKAQEVFVKNGYRPVVDGVPGAEDFPKPAGLFTIADLGGWPKVKKEFFDPKGSVMADVEKGIGVSVEG